VTDPRFRDPVPPLQIDAGGGGDWLKRHRAVARMEDELRMRLDVTDPMHPDNPASAGSPRGMLWFQAASWIVNRTEIRGSWFTLTGRIDGRPAVIRWTSETGFDDPSGRTAELIEAGATVRFLPVDPDFVAADHPAEVALLTALAVFDQRKAEKTGDVRWPIPVVPPGATP
jgi:hypothetical protein